LPAVHSVKFHGRHFDERENMKKQLGNTAVAIFTVLLFCSIALAAAVGWVWNILKLIEMTFDPLTGLLVVRVIGIFIVPLGCIVGYF
jgi:hypothetical protein